MSKLLVWEDGRMMFQSDPRLSASAMTEFRERLEDAIATWTSDRPLVIGGEQIEVVPVPTTDLGTIEEKLDLLVAIKEGSLRAPVADLIRRVQDFGFPVEGSPEYSAAIDRECARILRRSKS